MYYRNFIVFSLLVVACMSDVRAQASEDKIRAIRQRFQEINQDQSLKKVLLEADEAMDVSPDNGVELKGWFKGDTLVKMYFSVGLSFGIDDFEYYYDHGQLVFIYETQRCFHTDSTGMDQTKSQVNFEGRYYLDKGAIVEMKLKGKKRLSDEVDRAYVRTLVKEASDYSGRLYQHYKK